jgi:hypothetical protein
MVPKDRSEKLVLTIAYGQFVETALFYQLCFIAKTPSAVHRQKIIVIR